MQARAASTPAVRALVAALLSATARRPSALALRILLLAAAVVVLLSFYGVVEGAVARGPAKPLPVVPTDTGPQSADAAWQCETPPAGALHSICRRVAVVPSEGAMVRAAGLQRVAFGR